MLVKFKFDYSADKVLKTIPPEDYMELVAAIPGMEPAQEKFNCCTDELQTYLNEGWRIIAVCPPNAQRRPDYILGRRKNDV